MERKSIVFTYKRVRDASDESYVQYHYEPYEILCGTEYASENGKIFIDERSSNHYPYIESVKDIRSSYVYAFPLYTADMSKSRRDILYGEILSDSAIFEKCQLYHYHEMNEDYLQTFGGTRPNELFYVDPSNYQGLLDTEKEHKKELVVDKKICETIDESIPNIDFDLLKTTDDKKITHERPRIYSDDIYDTTKKTVICQDEQIRQMATTIAKNQMITNPNLKSNLLVCGASGVGKTEMFRVASKTLGIPLALEDLTEYTISGFKGKDLDEMLVHLFKNANYDVQSAERGIIVMDEIDKKVGNVGGYTSSSSAVLDSLLKMIEGHVYSFPHPKEQSKTVYLDTSYITFASLGAHEGIKELAKDKKVTGFSSIVDELKKTQKEIYTIDSLRKYGYGAQFLGRNDVLIVMNTLGVDELLKIIKESDTSQLKLYEELFYSALGVRLICEEDTLRKIAEEAHKRGVGARGIKAIVEHALSEVNYYLFSHNQYNEVIITPETIEDNKKFILR